MQQSHAESDVRGLQVDDWNDGDADVSDHPILVWPFKLGQRLQGCGRVHEAEQQTWYTCEQCRSHDDSRIHWNKGIYMLPATFQPLPPSVSKHPPLSHNHPLLLRMASKCNGVPTTWAIFFSPTSFFQLFRSYFRLVCVHSASILIPSSPANLLISKLQDLVWSMFLPWRIRCLLLLLLMSCPQNSRLTMGHRIMVSCPCTFQWFHILSLNFFNWLSCDHKFIHLQASASYAIFCSAGGSTFAPVQKSAAIWITLLSGNWTAVMVAPALHHMPCIPASSQQATPSLDLKELSFAHLFLFCRTGSLQQHGRLLLQSWRIVHEKHRTGRGHAGGQVYENMPLNFKIAIVILVIMYSQSP